MLHIVIWDHDIERIARIERNLSTALKRLSIRAVVTSVSEPPALARSPVAGKYPALEIAGDFWTLSPGKTISEENCYALMAMLL